MKNRMHGGRLSVGLDLFLSVRGFLKPRFNRVIDDPGERSGFLRLRTDAALRVVLDYCP